MMELLCIIFLTLLFVSVVVAILVCCEYKNALQKKQKQEKEQAMEIAHAIDLTFKDMEIKRLEEEIKKLKKRKKSK